MDSKKNGSDLEMTFVLNHDGDDYSGVMLVTGTHLKTGEHVEKEMPVRSFT